MHKLNVTFYDKFEKLLHLGSRTSQGSLAGHIRSFRFILAFTTIDQTGIFSIINA